MGNDNASLQKAIESSLAVLEAVKDDSVVDEVAKLRKNLKSMMEINRPMAEAYASELKAFDQGLIAKYGMKVARIIEGGILVALAVKAFYL